MSAPPTNGETGIARNLLDHYDHPGGYPGGSFTTALITALEKADYVNTYKLLTAFPDYAAPVYIMQTHGIEALEYWVTHGTLP